MNIIDLIFKANTSQLKTAQKDLDGVAKGTENAEKGAKGLAKSFDTLKGVGGPIGEVANTVGDLGDTLGKAGTAARALPPLMLAAAAGAGVLAAIRFAPILDGLSDVAKQFGYTTSQAAAFQDKLASVGGIQAFEKDLSRLQKAMFKSGEEGSAAAEGLQALGISVTEASDPMSVGAEIAEKYAQKIEDGNVTNEEAVALQKVLGQQYQESIFRMQEAADAQDRVNRFAQNGLGITKESVAAANAYGDAQDDVAYALKIMGSELVRVVVPAFTALVQAFANSYKNGGLVRGVFEGILTVINVLMVPIRALINGIVVIDTAFQALGKTVGAVFAAIATRSTAPLKELKQDLLALLRETTKQVEDNPLWVGATGTLEAPKGGSRAGGALAVDKPKKGSGTAEPKEAPGFYLDQVDEMLRKKKEAIADSEDAAAAREQSRLEALAQRYRDLADPLAKYVRELEEVRMLREANLLTTDQAIENEFRIQEAMQKTIDKMDGVEKKQEELNLGAEATKFVFGQVADAIGNAFVSGEFNFKSFLATLLKGLAQMVLQLTIIKPLMEWFQSTMQTGGMGGVASGIASFIGSFFAKGGAFKNGTQFFANGGVVNRATPFGMAGGKMGVMGEAGPEAVMPLVRGANGKLGVAAQGGGGGVNVQNNITVSIGSVDSEETQAQLLREVNKQTEAVTKKTLADAMRPGGMLYARRNAMA